ncbi:MAG: PAS domain S-box protein, partial [bacterium]
HQGVSGNQFGVIPPFFMPPFLLFRGIKDKNSPHIAKFIPISIGDTPDCPLSRILNGEELVEKEKEMVRRDGIGVFCLMSVNPFRGAQGELLGIVAFMKDISEWKKAQELLRESEAKYSALVEQAQDGVAIIQDGVFKFTNTASLRLIGYTSEELLGMPFLDIVAPESREMANWLYSLLLAGEKVPPFFEVKVICKDGTMKDGEVSSGLIQYNGKPAVMTITRDITGRRQIEKEKEKIQSQLLQAQKMEAIGLLAGGVAHDFNNLLTMIQGHATLALLEVGEDNPVAVDLKEIRLASGRAANLTRQLLLFSRKQPTEPVSLNLNSTVDELLKMIHRVIGEDIRITIDLEPNLQTVLADEGNIEQVIMNLVVNARDAMPKGGELTIRTENLTLDENQAANFPEARAGQFVRLSIIDTGYGMSSEVMSRIFEPFYTTKEIGKGSGLGLSVVYGIIKQHEGWINVSSAPQRGSTFAVCLPASLMIPEKKANEAVSVKKFQGEGERILVVEDEDGVRKVTATMLQENGYVVFTAANSRQALSIFGQERGNFNLLLSDVILPDQSAIELADQLLLLQPRLRILLISGYPDKQSQWTTIRERGFRFLHKPVSLVDLLRALREVIAEPADHRELP